MEKRSDMASTSGKPYKVWNKDRTIKKGVTANSIEEVITKGKLKLGFGVTDLVKIVLNEDGTEVDEEDYFSFLPNHTAFLLMSPAERWKPEGYMYDMASTSGKPYKVWNKDRTIKKGVTANSIEEVITKGKLKLGFGVTDPVTIVLNEDGTEIDEEDYFSFLPNNTAFLLMSPAERWKPEGYGPPSDEDLQSLPLSTPVQVTVSKRFTDIMWQQIREAEMMTIRINQHMLQKVKPGERLHVGGIDLELGDLAIIGREWLNYKVIDAFLVIVVMDHDDVLIMRCVLDNTQTIPWPHKKVDAYRLVLMPVFVDHKHWALLVANVSDGTVGVLDSSNHPQSQTYIEKFISYLNACVKSGGGKAIKWTEIHMKSVQQRDGFNCGPFVLLNAIAVVFKIDPMSLSVKLAESMRPFILDKLLKFAELKS